jgi:hypothetical protein
MKNFPVVCLDVLYEDLRISTVNCNLSKKFFLAAVNFFQLLVVKTFDPDLDKKCWIRVRIETNADPLVSMRISVRIHWFQCGSIGLNSDPLVSMRIHNTVPGK